MHLTLDGDFMNIKVHVLKFNGVLMHTEIVLSYEENDATHYYRIDRWNKPKKNFIQDEKNCIQLIKIASKKIVFEIDGDANELVSEWRNKFKDEEGDLCGNNCADAVQWFLENHTEVGELPGACEKPVSCDHVCLGFFAPSFLQCCNLPGRIMEGTQHKIKTNQIQTLDENKPLSELQMNYK